MTSRPARSTATVGTTTITRAVTVAAGVFAPGHLGELTSYLPFELVDDVLVETRTMQRRLRELPSRTGVYFVLALGLFPRIGYARVWAKLCAGLTGAGLAVPAVSEKALRDLRRRLGPAPLKALFEVVAGPLAQPRTPGTCFAGLRTVAFDGLNSPRVGAVPVVPVLTPLRSDTHDVVNQVPPLVPYDASEDAALLEGLRREGAAWAEDDVRAGRR